MEFPDYSGIFKPDSGFNAKDSWQTGFDNRGSDPFGVQGGSSNKFGEGMRMAGSALEKWGKNKDNDFNYYGNRNGGGMSGGGVQSSGDFTVIYPQQQQPYTIQGSKSPWGGVLGAVGALAAPFTNGASMALTGFNGFIG